MPEMSKIYRDRAPQSPQEFLECYRELARRREGQHPCSAKYIKALAEAVGYLAYVVHTAGDELHPDEEKRLCELLKQGLEIPD